MKEIGWVRREKMRAGVRNEGGKSHKSPINQHFSSSLLFLAKAGISGEAEKQIFAMNRLYPIRVQVLGWEN